MRAVVQRVSSASVVVNGETVGQVGRGFLVLLGVRRGDAAEDAHYLARKIVALRVFGDADGKMNLALADVDGAVLAVSQFTLYSDVRKGNRPSFLQAAAPDDGRRLYGVFVEALRDAGLEVRTGVFGADMKVSLLNDGPVTIVIDSEARSSPT